MDPRVEWISNRIPLIRKWLNIACALIGIGLLYFAYSSGKVPFHLIRHGQRIDGKIVDYVLVNMGPKALIETAPKKLHWQPIVEFQVGNKSFQFKDRILSNYFVSPNNIVKPPPSYPVAVLYDPADPSLAMLDNPSSSQLPFNWIPWAPAAILGALLLLISISNLLRA
jgi:hypothetical protein